MIIPCQGDTTDVEPSTHPQVIDDNLWKSLLESLAALERLICDTNADTCKDVLIELRDCVIVIQQRAAALRDQIDQTFVATIRAHGPIEIGDIRYIVTTDRTTRCLNTKRTTDVLLDAVAGDFSKFCDQLVAQPFKPASVRALVPHDAYQTCFETIVRSNVEKLMRVDQRFVKPKA